jgi:hypothetical protein
MKKNPKKKYFIRNKKMKKKRKKGIIIFINKLPAFCDKTQKRTLLSNSILKYIITFLMTILSSYMNCN